MMKRNPIHDTAEFQEAKNIFSEFVKRNQHPGAKNPMELQRIIDVSVNQRLAELNNPYLFRVREKDLNGNTSLIELVERSSEIKGGIINGKESSR